MLVPSRSSRRTLIGGSAAAFLASIAQRDLPAASAQRDRRLLDLFATLEQLQISRYQGVLEAFDTSAFAAAGASADARDLILSVLESERQHLAALTDLGAAPPTASVRAESDLPEALGLAAAMENLATAAYAGAIPDVRRRRVRNLFIGLHSVEARQAAILARLAGDSPLPTAIDRALPPEEALASIEAMGLNGTPEATPEAPVEDIAPLVEEIARTLGVNADDVQVANVEPRDWPDSSLGCPEPGMVYAQVITPGYLLEVAVGNEQFEFHTDTRGNVVRCP